MTNETPATQYTHGYGERGEIFSHRTASSRAGFFLPFLKEGMSVLDCGCGSGSITMGLAEIAAPGEVVGIDIGEAPIEYAQESAKEKDVSNVSFKVASLYDIPFEDASFDAIFSHNVLEHLQHPDKALLEMYRVLKPGGVIGIKDIDVDTHVLYPSGHPLNGMFDLWYRVWEHNGGHPRIGKQLRELLHDTGFKRVQGSAIVNSQGSEEGITNAGSVLSGPISNALDTAIELGWAKSDAKDMLEKHWASFSTDPRAFSSLNFYQVIGWKD